MIGDAAIIIVLLMASISMVFLYCKVTRVTLPARLVHGFQFLLIMAFVVIFILIIHAIRLTNLGGGAR